MIHVGPAGWSYPDWEGIVYPRRKPRGFHPLRYLSGYVNCVEVNSTFYATPRADFAELWLAQVADRPSFRFTVKLQDLFTHEPLSGDPAEVERQARAFLEGIEPLRAAGRLACLLVQFPLSFRHSSRSEARLERVQRLVGHLPLVLEVRHRSWFDGAALDSIADLGYSLAHIDLPYASDHPPADLPLVGRIGYLRLHGRNAASWFDPRAGRDRRYDYLYAPDEISEIVRLTRRIASGVDETFVITNNHFSGKSVANALEILAALEGRKPPAPSELVESFPRLASTVQIHGQERLF